MYVQIIIGFGILIFGAILSRLIQALQFKRIGMEKRDTLLRNMRRLRSFALVPALVAVVLFIIGIIVMPEIFSQLARLLVIFGASYVVLLNVLTIVSYYRAQCGGMFVVVSLFSKAIIFISLLAFCYLVLTAL